MTLLLLGGTLSKGLNRAFATLLAGALGVAAHQIAIHCGEKGEPILLGLFVFALGKHDFSYFHLMGGHAWGF